MKNPYAPSNVADETNQESNTRMASDLEPGLRAPNPITEPLPGRNGSVSSELKAKLEITELKAKIADLQNQIKNQNRLLLKASQNVSLLEADKDLIIYVLNHKTDDIKS